VRQRGVVMDALLTQVGLYALPLFGSLLLAFGIFQLVADLRRTDEKRVLDRLSDRGGQDRRKDTAESIIRRKTDPQTAMSMALGKFKFVPALQRALDQANMRWSATTVLFNVLAAGLFIGIGLHLLDAGMAVVVGTSLGVLLLPLVAIHVRRKMRLSKMLRQL